MIGIGLVTCGREAYSSAAQDAILDVLVNPGVVDVFHIERDPLPGEPGNLGVGKRKNRLLQQMLDDGCDWLFISEDDIIVLSLEAVTGYISACQASGYEHLMFHNHGPHNVTPLLVEGSIAVWPNYVGAWSIYSRHCLETCGLMDERFYNSWEHVEHSLRLAEAGFTAPWRGAADALGSELWLREQPGAIEGSVIRDAPGWGKAMVEGISAWQENHPSTYKQVFSHDG